MNRDLSNLNIGSILKTRESIMKYVRSAIHKRYSEDITECYKLFPVLQDNEILWQLIIKMLEYNEFGLTQEPVYDLFYNDFIDSLQKIVIEDGRQLSEEEVDLFDAFVFQVTKQLQYLIAEHTKRMFFTL